MGAGSIVVVQVFGAMDRNGAQLRTLELMRAVGHGRIRSIFVTLSGREGDLAAEIRGMDGDVVPLALGATFPSRFMRLLRSVRADVVHSHVHTFSGIPLALGAAAGVPVRVAHFRSDGDGRGGGPRRRSQRAAMRRLIDRYATAILGVSPSALSRGWRVGWERDPRCQVLPNAIDLTPFEGPVDVAAVRRDLGVGAERVVLHVGRAGPEKNRRRMVDVFATLDRRTPESVLVVVGRDRDGEDAELRARARGLGVADRVLMLGERTDVPNLLRAADLLLLPSRREGVPGVVLEARAAGTPVLASDLPGVRWVADRLGGISLRSLAEPDQEWAAVAEDLLARAPQSADRERSLERMRASPWTLPATGAALLRLWKADGIIEHK